MTQLLNESQRAMVAARIANMPKHLHRDASIEASVVSQPEAAELLKVSRSSVQRAKAVLDCGDEEIIREVRSGYEDMIPADDRLLRPGWPGELGDDELAFIKGRLLKDKALARRWGFRPGAKLRPDWAIRAVAQDGDPDNVAGNRSLARAHTPKPACSRDDGQSSDMKMETCRSETGNQASSPEPAVRVQGALALAGEP